MAAAPGAPPSASARRVYSESTWSASGGTKSGSSQFDWTAPEKAGGVTVTFTSTDGKKSTTSLTVHAPLLMAA